MTILFYNTTGPHGYLSNFARYGFEIDGKYWLTVEHYFQAQKFAGTEHELKIQRASTPKQAKDLGRSRDVPLRFDWEQIKDQVMRQAVLRKFETHGDIRALLLNTEDEELIENSPSDYYWGCGADGSGRNMLGKILMEVRAGLRRQAVQVSEPEA